MSTTTPISAELPDLTLWSVPEVAAATGLSTRYVRELITKRRLPVVKIGHYVRMRPADVAAFIEANTRPERAQ